MHLVLTVIAAVCALLALAGAAYYGLCVWAARRFIRDSVANVPADLAPPVSLLKSLKGLDPQMYAAFRSHCLQDYGEYELLFGVSDPNDPALELISRLQQEFPDASRTSGGVSRESWSERQGQHASANAATRAL